jgi:RNA polymerase sigma-70 factor (ECF subfamily)
MALSGQEATARLRALLDAGDYAGGTQLLARAHGNQLLGFLRRCLGDADEAQDVAQEVWIGVQQSLPRFEFGASPKTWLFRIARYKLIDHRRRPRLFATLTSSLIEGGGARGSTTLQRRQRPDAQLSIRERQDRVTAAVEALGERERELALYFICGRMTADEAAEVMELTVENVRQIKSRVLKALLAVASADPA